MIRSLVMGESLSADPAKEMSARAGEAFKQAIERRNALTEFDSSTLEERAIMREVAMSPPADVLSALANGDRDVLARRAREELAKRAARASEIRLCDGDRVVILTRDGEERTEVVRYTAMSHDELRIGFAAPLGYKPIIALRKVVEEPERPRCGRLAPGRDGGCARAPGHVGECR